MWGYRPNYGRSPKQMEAALLPPPPPPPPGSFQILLHGRQQHLSQPQLELQKQMPLQHATREQRSDSGSREQESRGGGGGECRLTSYSIKRLSREKTLGKGEDIPLRSSISGANERTAKERVLWKKETSPILTGIRKQNSF